MLSIISSVLALIALLHTLPFLALAVARDSCVRGVATLRFCAAAKRATLAPAYLLLLMRGGCGRQRRGQESAARLLTAGGTSPVPWLACRCTPATTASSSTFPQDSRKKKNSAITGAARCGAFRRAAVYARFYAVAAPLLALPLPQAQTPRCACRTASRASARLNPSAHSGA